MSADPRLERPRKTRDRQTEHSPKLMLPLCALCEPALGETQAATSTRGLAKTVRQVARPTSE